MYLIIVLGFVRLGILVYRLAVLSVGVIMCVRSVFPVLLMIIGLNNVLNVHLNANIVPSMENA